MNSGLAGSGRGGPGLVVEAGAACELRPLDGRALQVFLDVQEPEAVLALEPLVHPARGEVDTHRMHVERRRAAALNDVGEQPGAVSMSQVGEFLQVL